MFVFEDDFCESFRDSTVKNKSLTLFSQTVLFEVSINSPPKPEVNCGWDYVVDGSNW